MENTNFTLRLSDGPWYDGEWQGQEVWDANYEVVDSYGEVINETGRSGWPYADLIALDGAKCDKDGRVD